MFGVKRTSVSGALFVGCTSVNQPGPLESLLAHVLGLQASSLSLT